MVVTVSVLRDKLTAFSKSVEEVHQLEEELLQLAAR